MVSREQRPGEACSSHKGVGNMTKMRRLVAVLSVFVVAALVCLTRSQGEPGKPNAGPLVRPMPPRERQAEKELTGSKFEQGGVITYTTLKGENLFALQVKPQLPPAPVRKRD